MSELTFESMINLNRRLDALLIPHLVNEACLFDFQQALAPCRDLGGVYFWLLHARLTEAALLCAGHYADNCEFTAAGDLLVNPRCIRVYDKADPNRPKTKRRHTALSRQFKANGMKTEVFRKQFSSNLALHTETPPLLPVLTETMQCADIFCERYLSSITRRMQEIADTIAFLLAWSVGTVQELRQRRMSASAETRKFIDANLCRFERTAFDALGAELKAAECNRLSTSAFLNGPCANNLYPSCEDLENDRTLPVDERPQAVL